MTDQANANTNIASGEAEVDPRAQGEAAVASQAETDQESVRAAPGQRDESTDSPKGLQERLTEAQRKAGEAEDRYLRLRADMENYKKRMERTYAERAASGRKNLLMKVLQVKDNLERALQYGGQATAGEGLMEGVRLTLYQLEQLLDTEGVRQIQAQGKRFNPHLEEAVQSVENPDVPDHTVVQVVRNGYVLEDETNVLRPAQVIVSVGGPEESGRNG